MSDVFTLVPKQDQLRVWMEERRVFRPHEVLQWGLAPFYNRATRTKGQMHHDGLIRELSKEEKVLRGFNTTEGVYEWVGYHTV